MKTALWFAICVLAWGISIFLMTFIVKGPKGLSLGTILVYNLAGYAIGIGLLARNVDIGLSRNHLLAVLISLLYVAANYSYYRLSQAGHQVTILVPLTGLYVVVSVLLGIVLMHEPMTFRKGLGIVLAVAAAILLTTEA